MTNELAIYQHYDQLTKAATALQKSGYFSDVKSEAQAIVKVMAGAELGLPPFASMTGIHIIQGKPVLGANVMATLVKNDPRYDYQIVKCDNEICTLEWYQNGNKVGEDSFTMKEAQAAGLTGKDNWKKYPSDMLFARAISRGARRFAPGIFGGSPVYTPDEMGVDTDEDGYIEAQVVEVSEPEPSQDWIDKAIEDAGPKAIDEPMTIEKACKVENSKGTRYCMLTTEQLSNMTIGIGKGLNRPNLPDDKRQQYEMKLEAIKVLLQAHATGEITLPMAS